MNEMSNIAGQGAVSVTPRGRLYLANPILSGSAIIRGEVNCGTEIRLALQL
jgi:hypothetical protein